MLKTDYHMHTDFSSDSPAPMEEMIKAAIAAGFEEIALTDHVDYNSYGNPFIYQIDYKKYIPLLTRLQKKYESKIKILLGVELGLSPHLQKQIGQFTADFPFEFVIGSSHDTHKQDLYTGEFFKGKTKKEAFRLYFEEILENCKLFDAFNVYGHFDYIRRYGSYADNSLFYEDYQEIIDEILKTLIAKGKGLEVNTSGYRYGLDQIHPQPAILKRYRALKGEIITVGSDAHRPQDIGAHFDLAKVFLKEAGFKAITIFRERQPFWVDLD